MNLLKRALKEIFGQKSHKELIPEKPNHLDGILWGGAYLPHEAANTHFCFVGATGSGKTVSIRLLLQTVLPFVGMRGKSNGEKPGEWLDHRALIYDAKQDAFSILGGMPLPGKIKIKTLNPFDADGYAWDMAKDIKERAHAQELSAILIPPEPNSYQPFFGDAARGLLEGVITSLIINAGDKWTFRDVIYVMGAKDRIIEVLDQTEETRELISLYFDHEEVAKNIMSTVATKIKAYKIVAALWDKAFEKEKTVSLIDWLSTREEREKKGAKKEEAHNYILLLGNDETARTAIDSINQAVFKRVTQLILNQSNLNSAKDVELGMVAQGRLDRRRHWIILDEVGEAGKLDGLDRLMTKGRSKGAAVVLGFQDINGLQAVYGEKEANKFIGQCSNYSVLRIQSPETARWAASLFGETEAEEKYTDQSHQKTSGDTSSKTEGSSERLAYREVKGLMTGQLINIRQIDSENGLDGYYKSPYIEEPYGTVIAPDLLFPPSDKTWLDKEIAQEMIRRDKDDQKLRPWDDKRRDELGLKVSRKQRVAKFKEAKKKREEIAQEIAELMFYEKRHVLNPREIEELMALGEEAIAICKQALEKMLNDEKAKNSNNSTAGQRQVIIEVLDDEGEGEDGDPIKDLLSSQKNRTKEPVRADR